MNRTILIITEFRAAKILGNDLAGNHPLTERIPVHHFLTGSQAVLLGHVVIPVAGMKQIGQLLVRQTFIFGMNHSSAPCAVTGASGSAP